MAFLGNSFTTQDYTAKIDTFSGDGVTVAFTLSRVVLSASQVQATVENVPQNPASAFSVLNNIITFTSAPPVGANNVYVQYVSPVTQYNALQSTNNLTGGLTGDIPYQSTSGVTALLSPGAAGTFLQSNGAGVAPSWGSAGSIAGAITMWPTASAPTGYLLCNGASVSTSTYATLFSVIGYTFGGSGASFTLPDYRGRSPLGVSGSYALATTGGSADAIVVSHTHTVTDPGHVHGINGTIQLYGNPSSSGVLTQISSSNTFSAVTGISIATTGSSGTGANLQPYLAINFIIKT
jgi:microcystin-dependent protein